MGISSVERQLELSCAALSHATYFLEIEAIDQAMKHLDFARAQLKQLVLCQTYSKEQGRG